MLSWIPKLGILHSKQTTMYTRSRAISYYLNDQKITMLRPSVHNLSLYGLIYPTSQSWPSKTSLLTSPKTKNCKRDTA